MTEVFAFDFYEAEANMQPAEVALPLTVTATGTCNAVAFWFSLQLDEETELLTGPYEEKVAAPSTCAPSCAHNTLDSLGKLPRICSRCTTAGSAR